MTTTVMSWTRKGFKYAKYEGTNLTSPNAEALLTDDGVALVFDVSQYDTAVFTCVNKHASTNMTLKLFMSNFDDPGSTDSDFGEDSHWVQAKDFTGADVSITVTADGTPANNIVCTLDCNGIDYIAFRGTNGSGDISQAIDFALKCTKL